MQIISVQSNKGGAGKTTISVNLAVFLCKYGRVLLIDSDPQGSARRWSAERNSSPPFTVIGIDTETIHRDISQIARGYDWVIIDGPPRTEAIVRSGIIASNFVLVPVQPSPVDIWAIESTVALINEARIYKPNLRSLLVVNRKIVNTALGRDASEALKGYGCPISPYALHQRVAFPEASVSGRGVMESHARSAASREFNLMASNVLEALNGQED